MVVVDLVLVDGGEALLIAEGSQRLDARQCLAEVRVDGTPRRRIHPLHLDVGPPVELRQGRNIDASVPIECNVKHEHDAAGAINTVRAG